jgi:hypothetical protein
VDDLDEVGREWLMARNVVADWLGKLCPHHSRAQREHNAAALIAELAHHRMIIELVKEEDL